MPLGVPNQVFEYLTGNASNWMLGVRKKFIGMAGLLIVEERKKVKRKNGRLNLKKRMNGGVDAEDNGILWKSLTINCRYI